MGRSYNPWSDAEVAALKEGVQASRGGAISKHTSLGWLERVVFGGSKPLQRVF